MNWVEFSLSRLLLAEERVGKRVRAAQQEELDEDERSTKVLRSLGMVSDGTG